MVLGTNVILILLFGILIVTRTYTVTTQRIVGVVLIIVALLLSAGGFLNIRIG